MPNATNQKLIDIAQSSLEAAVASLAVYTGDKNAEHIQAVHRLSLMATCALCELKNREEGLEPPKQG